MPQIKNDQELQRTIGKLAEEAIQSASKEILKLFQEDYLKAIVFNSHGKNKVYSRTGEFFEAWDFSEIKKTLNTISTELWYNPSKLTTFDPDSFTHGSKYSSPNDIRSNLQDILNKAGYSSSLWLSVSRSLPYWDTFILNMFEGGQLVRIVSKHFTSNGFRRV